jgi:hypothetical protein
MLEIWNYSNFLKEAWLCALPELMVFYSLSQEDFSIFSKANLVPIADVYSKLGLAEKPHSGAREIRQACGGGSHCARV